MNFPFWIARRLRLNGTKEGANATGVTIAVTGVALALIIMEITIAIVLGFKNAITERVMGFDGKIWVLPEYSYNDASSAAAISNNPDLLNVIHEVMPLAKTSMRLSQPGILKTDNDFAGVYFTGNDADHDISFEKSNIIKGIFPDFSVDSNANKIVISNSTANLLGLDTQDKINACFFVDEAIKARKFEIAGIYETGFGDYDRTQAFASMATMQKIAGADSISGTRLTIDFADGLYDIESTAARLQQTLIDKYQAREISQLYPVDNVKHTGAVYFNWLNLLNTNVVVIFILMLCVSGFTLISSMFIIILERITTIGIMRSLGATKKMIRRIFIYMTMRIVAFGLIIGNIVGIGLLYLQKTFNIITLNPEMYYLKYVPVEINWLYFLYLNIGIVVVSWLILILPSRVASGISPAVTMRFE